MERLSAGGSGIRALLAPVGMLILRPHFLLLPLVGSVLVAALIELRSTLSTEQLSHSWPLTHEEVVAWCQVTSIAVLLFHLIPIYLLSAVAATHVWRHFKQGRTIRLVLHELHRHMRQIWWALIIGCAESALFMIVAFLLLQSVGEHEYLPLPLALYASTCFAVAAVLLIASFRALMQPFVAFHANLSREQAAPLAELMVRRELLSILIVLFGLGFSCYVLLNLLEISSLTAATILPSLIWYGAAALSTLTITTWQELSAEHVKVLQRGTVKVDVRPVVLPPILPFRRATNPLSQGELADILAFVRNADTIMEHSGSSAHK